MIRFPAVFLFVFLLLFPAASRADIYRWTDEGGTAHFTDDISNIPAGYRDKATTVIREAPPEPKPAPPPPAPTGRSRKKGTSYAPPPPSGYDESGGAYERDAIASEIEQLKAKIAAKEALIKRVDDRQNLALNPLRARVLDPADLELYKKYKAELPEDRRQLEYLESRLQNLK